MDPPWLQQEAQLAEDIARIDDILDCESGSESESGSGSESGSESGKEMLQARAVDANNNDDDNHKHELVMGLREPHPQHHLASRVCLLRCAVHKGRGEMEEAAGAIMRHIGCREAVVRFPSRKTAFKYECRGDCLQQVRF